LKRKPRHPVTNFAPALPLLHQHTPRYKGQPTGSLKWRRGSPEQHGVVAGQLESGPPESSTTGLAKEHSKVINDTLVPDRRQAGHPSPSRSPASPKLTHYPRTHQPRSPTVHQGNLGFDQGTTKRRIRNQGQYSLGLRGLGSKDLQGVEDIPRTKNKGKGEAHVITIYRG
jgi:hypothetical protein